MDNKHATSAGWDPLLIHLGAKIGDCIKMKRQRTAALWLLDGVDVTTDSVEGVFVGSQFAGVAIISLSKRFEVSGISSRNSPFPPLKPAKQSGLR